MKNVILIIWMSVLSIAISPLSVAGMEDSIGEKPEETDQLFLREEKVLLAPGKIEVGLDFFYSNDSDAEFLQLTDQYTYLYKSKSDTFTSAFNVRLGLLKNLELFASVPYTAYKQREVDFSGSIHTTTDKGIGDISSGLQYQFLREGLYRPDLALNISAKSRTGEDPYSLSEDELSMGSGHWDITTSLTAVKVLDPAVFFGRFGYTYTFDRDIGGVEVSVGDQINYSVGTGFVLNEQVTYNMQVTGSYQKSTEIDGDKIEGSSQNIISMNLGITAAFSENFYIQPTVGIGLTDEATDAVLGLSMTYKIK